MTLSKRFIISALLLSLFYANSVSAQTVADDINKYSILSFDNKQCTIRLQEIRRGHGLSISCLKDSLELEDINGVVGKPKVLNKHFLKIIYEPRMGTNAGMSQSLILCVNRNKIYIAADITSNHWFDAPSRREKYELNSKLIEQGEYAYRLFITVEHMFFSKKEPKENYNYHNKFELVFDQKRNIFYSNFKRIDTTFDIWNGGDYKQKQLNGNFPMIKLGPVEYYYINDMWYVQGINPLTGRNSLNVYCVR